MNLLFKHEREYLIGCSKREVENIKVVDRVTENKRNWDELLYMHLESHSFYVNIRFNENKEGCIVVRCMGNWPYEGRVDYPNSTLIQPDVERMNTESPNRGFFWLP
jgi:hypothetical protein